MKAVIPICVADLITTKFGPEKWSEILQAAGLDPSTRFLATQDVDDAAVLKTVQAACRVLGMNLKQLADAFGEHWVNVYARKIYGTYYRGVNSAREFLLKMDSVHDTVTRTIPNARPPRFDYRWEDENTLIMVYKSDRQLIDFVVGLVKGVGRYFNNPLMVSAISENRIRIKFK